MKVNMESIQRMMKEAFLCHFEIEEDLVSDPGRRAYKVRVLDVNNNKIGFHRAYDLTEAVNCALLKSIGEEIPWIKDETNS